VLSFAVADAFGVEEFVELLLLEQVVNNTKAAKRKV
jgi:hypothetical protein